MQRRPRLLTTEPGRSVLLLLVLVVVKIIWQVRLWQSGFISLAADEFVRGMRAYRWALRPQFDLVADMQGVWLPFEKYLNGFFLMLWPDPLFAPRLSVFLASLLLLAFFYLLVYRLFSSFPVAALSALLLTFNPWYTWLSGTPMLEIYYLACYLAGLLCLYLWIDEGRRGYWALAGVTFLLATGLHVQSWTLVNLVNLLTLPFLYRLWRRREYGRVARLFAFYLLGNSPIITFALIELATTGEIFAFLGEHTAYSRWFYQGYNVPVLDKFLYYPRVVVDNASAALWIGLGVSLVFLLRERDRLWKLCPLLLVFLILGLNSTLNVFSGPPSAAPGRYSFLHVMLLSPYLAYGVVRLQQWAQARAHPLWRSAALLLAPALLLSALWWGAVRIPRYPGTSMPVDSVAAGRRLNTLLADGERYMVELHYWDYLGVQMSARHYEGFLPDREQKVQNRDTPSFFLQEEEAICALLSAEEVGYVALLDEQLQARAAQLAFLEPRERVGRWLIYQVAPCQR